MSTAIYARRALDRARLLAAEAERRGEVDREAFATFFEAAIIFARNVTYHLEKEHASPAFKAWYSQWLKDVRADPSSEPLVRFLLSVRNVAVHERSIELQRTVFLSVTESLNLEIDDYAELTVIRGQPWYRRQPAILWQDARNVLLRPLRRYSFALRRHVKQLLGVTWRKKPPDTSITMRDDFFFTDPAWSTRPAIDLLGDYLDRLMALIEEAEQRFP